MPRILLITFFSGSSRFVGGKRFFFLAQELKKVYPRVCTLTSEEGNQEGRTSPPPLMDVYRSRSIPFPSRKSNTLLSRIFYRLWEDYLCVVDPFSGWIIPALHQGLKLIEKESIDLIVATGPPFSAMIVGALLSFWSKLPLILDYRDPRTSEARPTSSTGWKTVNVWFERFCTKRASAIVFCSEIMKENFEKRLAPETDAILTTITNGFRDVVTEPLPLGETGVHMVYAGELYGERRIRLVAEALSKLRVEGLISDSSFQFHVFGKINDDDRRAIEEFRLERIVRIRDKVSYDQVLRYLKGADILWLPSGSDVAYAIPFKFFDYLSVRRPVLTVAPRGSEMERLMSKIDCGEFARIDDKQAISSALKRVIEKKNNYTFNGISEFTWQNVGRDYIDVIEKVISS